MRILLDECLPRGLKTELPGHDVSTVPECGWAGKKNGELLGLAAERFDVFVTIDASLKYQQNLAALPLCVVALAARSNRLDDLRPLVPLLLEALARVRPGSLIQVSPQLH